MMAPRPVRLDHAEKVTVLWKLHCIQRHVQGGVRPTSATLSMSTTRGGMKSGWDWEDDKMDSTKTLLWLW